MSTKYLSQTTQPNDSINLRCHDLEVDGTFIHNGGGGGSSFVDITVSGKIERTLANVTQLTSTTTSVTANGYAGMITTFDNPGTMSMSNFTFTVNNDKVTANSIVIACLSGHYGVLSGIPVIQVNFTTAGSFNIIVTNVDSANFLTGSLTINYNIIEPITA